MFILEHKLINEICCKNTVKALSCYKNLFDKFKRDYLTDNYSLTSLKLSMISLNSSIYGHCSKDFICTSLVHSKRNLFNDTISTQICINKLFLLGQQIVLFYISNIGNTCIYTENPIVKQTLNYIHSHIDENLTLDKISSNVHLNKNYLSNLFIKCTGYNISNYINIIKIEKSKLLLKNSNATILEISLECGFNSESYFCSTFKKLTGYTPTSYKEFNC